MNAMSARMTTVAMLILTGAACSGGDDPVPVTAVVTDGDAGGSSRSTPDDGGQDSGVRLGAPIDVPADETWHWVPFSDAQCADGSSAGLAVSFTAKSRDVLVFFEGGGDCWNTATCGLNTASHLHGLGPDPLTASLQGTNGSTGVFNRTDVDNPFRDWSFVNVTYCTGDSHLGNNVATYPGLAPVHHVGYANVTAYLKRVVPTFADAKRVVVAGSSAGGMGATGNYDQIARVFHAVGGPLPFLVNDAGPVLRPEWLPPSMQQELRQAWGFDATVGTYCPECNPTAGYHQGWKAAGDDWPGMRGAFLSATQDQAVRTLYGLFNGSLTPMDPVFFNAGLVDLRDWMHTWTSATSPAKVRTFLYPGTRHMALEQVSFHDTPGLSAFLNAMLAGDASWSDVGP